VLHHPLSHILLQCLHRVKTKRNKNVANVEVANILFITDKISVRLNNIQTLSQWNIAWKAFMSRMTKTQTLELCIRQFLYFLSLFSQVIKIMKLKSWGRTIEVKIHPLFFFYQSVSDSSSVPTQLQSNLLFSFHVPNLLHLSLSSVHTKQTQSISITNFSPPISNMK
jgi:hypothetical protein